MGRSLSLCKCLQWPQQPATPAVRNPSVPNHFDTVSVSAFVRSLARGAASRVTSDMASTTSEERRGVCHLVNVVHAGQ